MPPILTFPTALGCGGIGNESGEARLSDGVKSYGEGHRALPF
jgi:hypothetical protein